MSNNLNYPSRNEVESWWNSLGYPLQTEIIEQVYPDCKIGAEGWKYLDLETKVEIYQENSCAE